MTDSKSFSLWLSLLLPLGCSPSPSGTTPASPASETRTEYTLEGSGPELYEKILVPPLFAPWADDLVNRAHLERGDRVLDVGTGTGIVARRATAIVGPSGSVTALDISPDMLAVARKAPAPAQPIIEWIEGDALDLRFPDATFNVVLCQQALQFFPDRAQALREMFRVLAPGGRIAVSSWRSPELNPYAIEFAKVVDKQVGPEAGAETRSPFGWDNQRELVQTLKSAGFSNVQADAVTLDMREPDLTTFIINDLLAYPSTGRTIASWSTAEKDALVGEILAALEKYKTGDSWTIPWVANVAVANK